MCAQVGSAGQRRSPASSSAGQAAAAAGAEASSAAVRAQSGAAGHTGLPPAQPAAAAAEGGNSVAAAAAAVKPAAPAPAPPAAEGGAGRPGSSEPACHDSFINLSTYIKSEEHARSLLDGAVAEAGCSGLKPYSAVGAKATISLTFSKELLKGSETVKLRSAEDGMHVNRSYGRNNSVLVTVTQGSTEQLGQHTSMWMLVLLYHSRLHSMPRASWILTPAWKQLAAAIEGEQ